MANRLLGYVRVSTKKQCVDRQLDVLRKHGVPKKNIFVDKISGKTYTRDGFKKLCETAQPGDTIIVSELNRIGRTMKELLEILETWNSEGIIFKSIKESIDLSSPTGKLMLQLLASLAEFEASITRERTLEGLAAAKELGHIGGRPKVKQEVIDKAIKLYKTGVHSVKEVCELTNISSATLYRYLKESKKNEYEH